MEFTDQTHPVPEQQKQLIKTSRQLKLIFLYMSVVNTFQSSYID